MTRSPIAFYPVLGPRLALGRGGDLARRLDRPGALRVSHARAGLRLIARGLGGRGPVLLPDFLCASAVEPFAAEGLDVARYRVGPDLAPDLDELSALARDGARAAMMVSYFGLSQPVERFREVCRSAEIGLIDDSAHSLLSDHDGAPYGTLGDAGVVSVRKALATPDGAVLFGSSAGDPDGLQRTRPPSSRYLVRTLARRADALLRTDVLGRRARARSGQLPSEAQHEDERAAWSRLTERVVDAADVERERELRRRAFAAWPALLEGAGAVALAGTPAPDIGPTGFPVRITDEERFARRMRELRVEWIRWPDRPSDSAEFPRGVGVLPTHSVRTA